ncbi:MAG: Fumble domain-containing protein [Chloroflexi bacterium]|nr:Fumble domain-containing protein [Chloroflexota bacterium]
MYRIAIDFGGSNTDILIARLDASEERGGEISQRRTTSAINPTVDAIRALVAQAGLGVAEVESIVVTGGRNRQLPEVLDGIPLRRVGEVEAIGRGGLLAAGLQEALVVSMGTGTAMVLAAGDQFRHLGGSAVGGGTLLGLGQLLLGTADPLEISALAAQGDLTRVDLTVGDIIGGPVGNIPADFSAAHFGKAFKAARIDGFARPRREDVAAGLCNLIGQAIATTVLSTASTVQQSVIVLTGHLVEVPAVRDAMDAVDRLGAGNRFVVPAYPGFATALGALGGE